MTKMSWGKKGGKEHHGILMKNREMVRENKIKNEKIKDFGKAEGQLAQGGMC